MLAHKAIVWVREEGINIWALNFPAWHLQDSLVAPVVWDSDEYTAMVQGLMPLLARCFHPDTNEFLGAPHPKMLV